MTVMELAPNDDLKAEAHRFRESGELGRSDALNRLFDFLLERSVAGNVPKEIEVAREVFGKDTQFDTMQDASVRVYIYRLRKKLDDYYLLRNAETRLLIPRGEYRLALGPTASIPIPADREEVLDPDDGASPLPSAVLSARDPKLWAGLAALLLLISAIGWLVVLNRDDEEPSLAALKHAPWSSLDTRTWPTFVVLGDYYIFGEMGQNRELSRLVREFSVNSRQDLDEFLMFNPDLIGQYVDLDLHYLPVAAAPALHSIEPLVRAAGKSGPGPLRIVTASSLNAGMIRGANLVYVGYFSALGVLGAPTFAASKFGIGASYDEIIDRKTGKHYLSDWARVVDAKSPTRDYGYIASLPGPSGTRIIIIAGTRDAGMMQAADIASNPAELERIAKLTKDAPAFEALYEVQTMGNTNFASRLVAAYPLQAGDVWRHISDAEDSMPGLPGRKEPTKTESSRPQPDQIGL